MKACRQSERVTQWPRTGQPYMCPSVYSEKALQTVLAFVLAVTVLIVTHELGHYSAA